MANDKVKVLFVPGHKVRDKNVDFALGGHHYVYDFIPEDEIWIEDELKNKNDVNEIIAHEKIERTLMKSLGFGYEEAHEVASKIEENLRKKGTEMKKTASQIADMVLEKLAISPGLARNVLVRNAQKIFSQKLNPKNISDAVRNVRWSDAPKSISKLVTTPASNYIGAKFPAASRTFAKAMEGVTKSPGDFEKYLLKHMSKPTGAQQYMKELSQKPRSAFVGRFFQS